MFLKCKDDLICYDRSMVDIAGSSEVIVGEFVPGCIGGENDITSTNYCINPNDLDLPPPGISTTTNNNNDNNDVNNDMQHLPFKLRLYWEDGYYWQESYDETFWCMACLPYGHCYDQSSMFITWCQQWNKKFIFEPISNDDSEDDEVLIKIIDVYFPTGATTHVYGYGQNSNGVRRSNGRGHYGFRGITGNLDTGTNNVSKGGQYFGQFCLQSDSNTKDVIIAYCNSDIPEQLWKPQLGSSFDSFEGFEITQTTNPEMCMTQRHHPKHGEIVKLESCEIARKSNTSKWMKY